MLVNMRLLDFQCFLIILSSILVAATADIYIVTVEGEPVISYAGGVDGFEAIAVDSDEKIDTARYLKSFILGFEIVRNGVTASILSILIFAWTCGEILVSIFSTKAN